MERLTKRSGPMVWYNGEYEGRKLPFEPCEVISSCSSHDIRKILVRLANYEDIGLEPDEIKTIIFEGSVTYEERKATYKVALQKWGADAQTMMVIEEMSELTKEICKLGRGKRDMESLVDEIADVTIMLEQLRLMYDLDDRVCAHMDEKIQRLQGRLGMADASKGAEQ